MKVKKLKQLLEELKDDWEIAIEANRTDTNSYLEIIDIEIFNLDVDKIIWSVLIKTR